MQAQTASLPPSARSRVALGLTAAAAEGRFELQVCQDCDSVQYPPREACCKCLSPQLRWREQDGAGQLLAINLAQANRDPEVYADPDRFDVTRSGLAPLTFGHGEHFCVGTALARLETEELIAMLLPRLPGARIISDPIKWRPTPAFRCPRELMIQFASPRT